MFSALSAGYVVTIMFLFWAVRKARQGERPGFEKSKRFILIWGLTIPGAVFLSVLFYSVIVGQTLSVKPYKDALTIHVTGKQWWWDVRYMHGSDVIANTANEIHVPVGVPVKLKLSTNDVIHSFWAPNLSGKMDLIPGRSNEMWLQVDKEGVWRGACAEFCGVQHAHMGFEVIAENSAKYYQWLDWQRHPAISPASESLRHGMEAFVTGPCGMCHAVRGTTAHGSAGPDLTHVAGRRTIAAGTLPNTPEHLGRWIVNAQATKPGNHMPRLNLDSERVNSLVAYLGTLK
jgi:cytochrome c oxidase subunit 2